MSVFCRLSNSDLLLKALSCAFIHKESWASVFFTDAAVVLRVEGEDQSTTATAMLPKAVFSEYAVTETSLCVHVGTLMDALLMLGAPTAQSDHTCTVLAYPTSDAKLLVEVADTAVESSEWGGGAFGAPSRAAASDRGGRRLFQCKLVTRPVKAYLLDLRFHDAPLQAQATVLGDTLRTLIQDLNHCSCAKVEVEVSAEHGVHLRGLGSPFGEVTIWLKPHSDALLSVEDSTSGESRTSPARTCVSMRHLAVACGVKPGGGAGGAANAGRGGGGGDGLGFATSTAASGAGAGTAGYVFERLTLQINSQGQLGVIHMQRNHEVKVTVTVIVGPAFDYATL